MTYGLMSARVGHAAAAAFAWSQIPIGGGGFCDGIDIATDGTMILRSDTPPSPYWWNGTTWIPQATSSSMPSGFVGQRNATDVLVVGAWDIRVAPSTSTKAYMVLANAVFLTTNLGASTTWTQLTNFPTQTDLASNDVFRAMNYRMAVDPQNDAICFIGTVSGGLQRTVDSGANWTTRTVGSGAGTSGAGMLIAFDPTSSVSGSAKQGLFVLRYGDGVYHSTDGGGSFTKLNTTGMPTTAYNMIVDQNGKLWIPEASGSFQNLWTWTSGGGWVQNAQVFPFNSPLQGIAIDPSNANNIVVCAGGAGIFTSTDGGSTWNLNVYTNTTITDDGGSPWQAFNYPGGAYSLTLGNMRFDPSGKLWQAFGLGVMAASTPFASTTAIAFVTHNKGVEALDATMIIHPPGGNPIGSSWDIPIWNLTSYTTSPSTYKPDSYYNGLFAADITTSRGWGLDWAKSDPTYIGALTGTTGGVTGMYSTNRGVTWTAYTDQSGFPSTFFGGTIAISTPLNIVTMAGGLFYTLDGGAHFHTPTTFTGSTGAGGQVPSQMVAADPNNALTFILFVSAGGTNPGIHKTTDGGVNWTRLSSGSPFIPASESFGPRLLGIPGQNNHFFYASGYLDTGNLPHTNSRLYRTTDGGTTWNTITNVGEVYCIDYGTTVSGQSYPTLYWAGWYDQGSGHEIGVWKTVDNFATVTRLGGVPYPNGWYGTINDIAGDKSIDGACSIAYFGGGFKTFR